MEATIILLNGNKVSLYEWQKMYNLTIGSSQLGRFFDIGEPNFKDGLIISEGIIRLLDVIRFIRNKPINVNSLDRTDSDQDRLRKQGYRTATFSPHVVKLAADIDTVNEEDTLNLLNCINDASDLLGYQVRVGWKKYLEDGSTFIHVDICPMYYAVGKVWNNKEHPRVWENINEW